MSVEGDMDHFFALHEFVQGYLNKHGGLSNALLACKYSNIARVQTALYRFLKNSHGAFLNEFFF